MDKQEHGIKARVYRAIKNPPTSSRSFATWIDTTAATLSKQAACRKDSFEPYTEPFRPLNEIELRSIVRADLEMHIGDSPISAFLVSYQALPGRFTICNVLLDGRRLYSGCSRCSYTDRWLPIRGKMQAFRRAIEQSEGVELSGVDKPEVKNQEEKSPSITKSFKNIRIGDKIRNKGTGQSFTVEHIEYYDTMPETPKTLILSRIITASNPDEWEHTGFRLEEKYNLEDKDM